MKSTSRAVVLAAADFTPQALGKKKRNEDKDKKQQCTITEKGEPKEDKSEANTDRRTVRNETKP